MMQMIKTGLMCAGIALATGSVFAQDMKKDATTDTMKQPTLQECKDQMAMARTDAMKNDPAVMKKDAACADVMKNNGTMMKDGATGTMKGDTKK